MPPLLTLLLLFSALCLATECLSEREGGKDNKAGIKMGKSNGGRACDCDRLGRTTRRTTTQEGFRKDRDCDGAFYFITSASLASRSQTCQFAKRQGDHVRRESEKKEGTS